MRAQGQVPPVDGWGFPVLTGLGLAAPHTHPHDTHAGGGGELVGDSLLRRLVTPQLQTLTDS